MDETYNLEFVKPSASRYFLIMIAQEEFAKAFIMFLVKEEIVHLTPPVLRAINDHSCKQLVGIILDYIIMHCETWEEAETTIRNDIDMGDCFPIEVISAMELLRYEKIGRWESGYGVYVGEFNFDAKAHRIGKGKKDRRKQDALYVRIGRDGRVSSTPYTIREDETRDEFERAGRYKSFFDTVLNEGVTGYRYDKAMAELKFLFKTHRA